jgi:cytochrome c551/c552
LSIALGIIADAGGLGDSLGAAGLDCHARWGPFILSGERAETEKLRVDLSRLPVGEVLVGFLLAATIATFATALIFHGGGSTEGGAGVGSKLPETLEERGQFVAATNGCLGCHTTTGQVMVGPSWKGLFGKSEALTDGSTVTVDEAYVRESVQNPLAKVVKGFPPAMPSFATLSDEEIQAIVAYIQSVE